MGVRLYPALQNNPNFKKLYSGISWYSILLIMKEVGIPTPKSVIIEEDPESKEFSVLVNNWVNNKILIRKEVPDIVLRLHSG